MAEPTLLPERLQYRPTKIELDESIEKAKATLLKKIKRSVYVYRVDCGGCNGCEIEIFGSITPVFDVERFGIKVVPSPRHADVLLYTGAVTRAMRMPALRAFEAAPDPKIVVSYGACGCTGGIFYDNYCVWGGTDKILPVDVYIPGCPPRFFQSFPVKHENYRLEIPFQDNLDLFFWIDGLYKDRIEACPVCAPDVRKQLVADKKSGITVRFHPLHSPLVAFSRRFPTLKNIGTSHLVRKR